MVLILDCPIFFGFRDLFRPRSADGFFELRDEAVEFRVFISEVLGEVVISPSRGLRLRYFERISVLPIAFLLNSLFMYLFEVCNC